MGIDWHRLHRVDGAAPDTPKSFMAYDAATFSDLRFPEGGLACCLNGGGGFISHHRYLRLQDQHARDVSRDAPPGKGVPNFSLVQNRCSLLPFSFCQSRNLYIEKEIFRLSLLFRWSLLW